MTNVDLKTPPATTGPQPPGGMPKRSWFSWIVGGIIALLVVVAGASVAANQGISGQAMMPATIKVSGVLLLTDYAGFTGHTQGAPCYGNGGYDDLSQGTSVTVYDSTGAIIGGGSIDAATFNGTSCAMTFDISDIPSGKGFYQLEVGHRGKISANERDMENGTLYFVGTIG